MRGGGAEHREGGGHALRGRRGWWKRRLCLVLKCCSACACDMGRADMWWLQNGTTALHLAALEGHTEALQALLKHGADTTAKGYNGNTALHYAALGGRTEALQALLEHGADTTPTDNAMRQPRSSSLSGVAAPC